MHQDLVDCVSTAKMARDAVIAKTMDVKEAMAVAANNYTIVVSHALDLRERMFLGNYHEAPQLGGITIEATPEAAKPPERKLGRGRPRKRDGA